MLPFLFPDESFVVLSVLKSSVFPWAEFIVWLFGHGGGRRSMGGSLPKAQRQLVWLPRLAEPFFFQFPRCLRKQKAFRSNWWFRWIMPGYTMCGWDCFAPAISHGLAASMTYLKFWPLISSAGRGRSTSNCLHWSKGGVAEGANAIHIFSLAA